MRQIFQIITSCDAESSHEIFSGRLQVTIIPILIRGWHIIFRAAKICIARYGGCPFEVHEPGFGFSLGGRVELASAKQFVR